MSTPLGGGDVTVVRQGPVAPQAAARIADAVRGVLAERGASGAARVRLIGGSRLGGPLLMQVNADVVGAAVRVQAHGSVDEVVDRAAPRLRRGLDGVAGPWQPRPWPDPTRALLSVIGDGAVVRRKTVPLARFEPVAAAAVMDARDYDAHLFVDADTGEDAVVMRAGPTGARLARQHRMRPPATPSVLTVHPHPTPTLTEPAAVRRLCAHGLPLLFYTDNDSGRGRLLYRRYDGDLGLVLPADTAPRARSIVELGRDEALTLLASVDYGRVVFTSNALPAIRPVNHVLDDGEIIVRTRVSAALTGAVRAAPDVVVAYQADDLDAAGRTGWSVVATGKARTIGDADRVAKYEQLLRPWVNEVMDTVIAIEPTLVTGIRLVDDPVPNPIEPNQEGR